MNAVLIIIVIIMIIAGFFFLKHLQEKQIVIEKENEKLNAEIIEKEINAKAKEQTAKNDKAAEEKVKKPVKKLSQMNRKGGSE